MFVFWKIMIVFCMHDLFSPDCLTHILHLGWNRQLENAGSLIFASRQTPGKHRRKSTSAVYPNYTREIKHSNEQVPLFNSYYLDYWYTPRLQICPLYIFGNNPPQMVPRDLNTGFQMAAWFRAKSTTLYTHCWLFESTNRFLESLVKLVIFNEALILGDPTNPILRTNVHNVLRALSPLT